MSGEQDDRDGRLRDLHERLGPLAQRFDAEDDALAVLQSSSARALVTGFGPTNAPTVGTLSVMLGVIETHTALATDSVVVISDLGAWNARTNEWEHLVRVRDGMARFLRALGYEGRIRSHLDAANLVRAGRLARFLTLEDLAMHSEEFTELYASIGALGSDVGVIVDTLYTVADILEPVERGMPTLMVSGREERYFFLLARHVLSVQGARLPAWLPPIGPPIGGLFFRVLPGFGGYSKMSKSVPGSAVHVGMDQTGIRRMLESESELDQATLHLAVRLASGWDADVVAEATAAYHDRGRKPDRWRRTKIAFADRFIEFARLWDDCLVH